MKKILTVFIAVIIVIIVLNINKNRIVGFIIARTLQRLAGLNLSIQSINWVMLNSAIDITGLEIYNPEDYPDKVMIDIPYIYIKYNPAALIKGKIVLPELRLHLKEFCIVKNNKGKFNISYIKSIREQKHKISREKKTKMPPIHIASLQLKVGRVIYKDYSRRTSPLIKEFNINLDEEYKDISDLGTLVNIIIAKALRKTAIDRLTNFDLDIITDYLPPGLKPGTEIITESTEGIKKITKEGVKKTTKAIKKTAEVLTELFYLPAAKNENE